MENGGVSVGALGAGGGHARLIGGVQTQRIDEPVAVVVRQVHDGAVGDLAVHFGEADVALGMQALGGLVVDDPVGFDRRVAIIDLHVADGRHAVIGIVVVDLVRLHEHLLLVAGFFPRDGDPGFRPRRRGRREAETLGQSRRAREQRRRKPGWRGRQLTLRRHGDRAEAMMDERKPAPPSPVLLVQQRNKPRQAADKHRQPSRCRRVHQLGLRHILSHFR